MSFSQEFKMLRYTLHFTQKRLAEELSVPESTLRSWETGKCLPSYSTLEAILAYLDLLRQRGADYSFSRIADELQKNFNAEKAQKGRHTKNVKSK